VLYFRQNSRLLITPFLLFIPIFISVGSDYSISLDRSVWEPYQYEILKNTREYLVSLPISSFVLAFLTLKYLKKSSIDAFLLIYIAYILFVIFISYIFGEIDATFFKTIIGMSTFIVGSYVFDEYFSKNRLQYDEVFMYVMLPLSIILLLLISSSLYYANDAFIFDSVVVYNYGQYLALVFLVLVGSSYHNAVFSGIFFLAVMFMANTTGNNTVKVLLLISFVMYLVRYFVPNNYNSLISKLFLLLSCVGLIVYISISINYSFFLLDYLPDTLGLRMKILYDYYLSIDIIDIINPAHHYNVFFENGLHNEFLQVIGATGIIGGILYYYYILSRILIISDYDYFISILFVLIIIVAGLTILPTLHPYTSIAIAYMLSLYRNLSLNVEGRYHKICETGS